MSSALAAFLSPDHEAPLMPPSLKNSYSSTAPFQSPIQVSWTSTEQNVAIQEHLNVTFSKNGCDIQQEALVISGGNFTNCSFSFIFK